MTALTVLAAGSPTGQRCAEHEFTCTSAGHGLRAADIGPGGLASPRGERNAWLIGPDQRPFGSNFVFYHMNRVNVSQMEAGRQRILTTVYGWCQPTLRRRRAFMDSSRRRTAGRQAGLAGSA